MTIRALLFILLLSFTSVTLTSCASSSPANDDVLSEVEDADSEDIDLAENDDAQDDEEFEDDEDSEQDDLAEEDSVNEDEIAESDESDEVADENLDEELNEDEEFEGDEVASEDEAIEDELDEEGDGLEEDLAEDSTGEELEQEVAQDGIPEENLEDSEEVRSGVVSQDLGEGSAPYVDITDIKYLASNDGGAVEVKTTGDAQYTTRLNPETNQYVIEIMNAGLPARLKRPYIMKDFQGAFGAINAYKKSGSNIARIVIQLKESMEPQIQKEGNTILVLPSSGEMSVAANDAPADEPVAEDTGSSSEDWNPYDKGFEQDDRILKARTLDEFLTGGSKFYGKKISIQIADTDVREVLDFISEFSGANIVISDDVQGRISVKLRQVPWDQALVTVMRSLNLGYLRQGNVIRISKLETLQQEAQAANAIVLAQKTLAPLKVKVIPISFAAVDELEKQVQKFLTKNRGQVVSDKRTSSLIVTDTIDILDRITRLVKELDRPPAQVLIEGKIVEATEVFTRQIGVNWGFTGANHNLSPSGGALGAPIDLRTSLGIRPIESSVAAASSTRLNVNVGTLKFLGNLTSTLALAERDSMVKVISSPRIMAVNKQKAEIGQKGQILTKVERSEPGSTVIATEVKREDVELKLGVTPQITSNGSVILTVDILRQFAGAADGTLGERPINTRSAKTQVLVKNGETAVIGGIYQSDVSEAEAGTPVLKDIPILGWLFKSKSTERIKNELLLFLTPRILNARDQGTSEQL